MTNLILTPDNKVCELYLLNYPQLYYKDLARKSSTGVNMYYAFHFWVYE